MSSPIPVFRANSPKVIHEVIDGEAILVNLDNGNYYSMDKLAAEVWNVIQAGATLKTVVDDIESRYRAERPEIEAAISDLVRELQDEGLLVASESAANGTSHNGSNARPAAQPVGEKQSFEKPMLQKYTDMEDLLALDPIHDVADSGWPNIPKGDG